MDSKNINNKTSPNQMRVFMKRMRTSNFVAENKEITKRELSMRDMLKITRTLNEAEDVKESEVNLATEKDLDKLTTGFMNSFKTAKMNISAKFLGLNTDPKLKLTKDMAFWGGTISGAIQFTYTVTPNKTDSGTEFNYLPEFSVDDPDNQQIIKNIETYYDTFYKYWQDNFQKS